MKKGKLFMLSFFAVLFMSTALNAQWSSFTKPNVTVNNSAGNHEGVALYTQLCQANGFSGIEDFVQNCCLTMAQTIYYSVGEANAHNLQNITYELTDGGSLSAKGGTPPNIFITFDVNHIVTFANQYGNDAAITEVLGVLCHELTHGYQKEPKNCGAYDGNSEFFGEIEGLADLGRLLTGGFNPERNPANGGSWTQGYTTTAFFYLWLSKTKAQVEANFIKDLNLTAQNMETWSHEAMCQQLFGQSVQSLWNEYQGQISQYPWTNQQSVTANFTASNTTVETGQTVTYTNSSSNATAYQWTFEGGSPSSSTATNPTVTYNTEGVFTVTLEAINGTESATKTGTITVNAPTNSLSDITNLGGQITAQYSDSPTSEGIANITDNSSYSKFLTFNSSAWVNYYLATPYIVTQYTLTSANDAAERDPYSWTLKGSNDGSNWVSLDSRSTEDFASRYETRRFSFTNNQAFKHHRLEMTNNSGSILQIAELELFGVEGSLVEPPVASFSTSATTITQGESITFTDNSQNITSRTWLFEGGNISSSSQQTVTVAYSTAGTYNVTLAVSNNGGNDSKSIQITVNPLDQELTDITDLGGQITAQYADSPQGEGITNLIDNSSYSKFLTFNSTAWISYYLSTPYIVTEYSITSANDAAERDPYHWTLEGSNDGSNWTTLDSRSYQNFASRYETRSFTFSNSNAFVYHRLQMINNSGSILQIAELELWGTQGNSSVLPIAPNTKTAINNHEQIGSGNINIYPNPFADKINISISDFNEKANISIYTVLGTQLFTTDTRDSKTEISTSDLPSGVYIISVENGVTIENSQIIKK